MERSARLFEEHNGTDRVFSNADWLVIPIDADKGKDTVLVHGRVYWWNPYRLHVKLYVNPI